MVVSDRKFKSVYVTFSLLPDLHNQRHLSGQYFSQGRILNAFEYYLIITIIITSSLRTNILVLFLY